jgi:hypothetical protein
VKELMDELVRLEREQGSMGIIIHPSQVGNVNNAQSMGGAYGVKPMLNLILWTSVRRNGGCRFPKT